MYRSTSYGYEDQNSSSLMPFLMGCMIGIGVSVLYSAGRNNRLGAGVGNVIHTVEDKAVQAKDTIVQKAADIKTSVAERVGGHKDGQTLSLIHI